MKDKEDLRAEVVEVGYPLSQIEVPALTGRQAISDGLSGADSEKRLAHVTALVEFSRRAPDCFEQYSDTVIGFLVKHVLLVSTIEDPVRLNRITLWLQSLTITGFRTKWKSTGIGKRTVKCRTSHGPRFSP